MATEKGTMSALLKEAAKKYDFEVGSLSDTLNEVNGISTGNLSLDYITGVGGLPQGRSVELYGPTSSGKTTAAMQAAAQLQKEIIDSGRDEYIVYLDFEHTLDKNYSRALGLDLDHPSVILLQPDCLEAGAQFARDSVNTGQVRFLIWDSVAESTPSAIMAADSGKPTVAVRARLISELLQQINGPLHKNNATLALINHCTKEIPMGYSPGPAKTITPGGNGLKFYASLRIEFSPAKVVKGERYDPLTNEMKSVSVSTDVIAKIIKNKVGVPARSCTLRVRYGKGFDNFWSAMQVLLNHKIVMSSAGYYYFDKKSEHLAHADMEVNGTGRPNIRTEDRLLEFADTHLDWRDLVIAEAVKVVAEATPSASTTPVDTESLGRVDWTTGELLD